ncbi:MAG: cytochrome c3 family protein [Myxococcales bacterium]|nr:cytochrome c3 family protein [Myxococcales bacterium]
MLSWKWILWAIGSLLSFIGLGLLMTSPNHISLFANSRTLLLPGRTTDGHYQIELSCESCHSAPFTDVNALQDACIRCHGEELSRVEDSHPRAKFTDPRNADRVAKLDARWCITCHREHQPEVTSAMGLSLPTDYCFACHENVGSDRPTHKDLGFETCSINGCHNFHDNQALYEDFLTQHRDDQATDVNAKLPERNLREWALTNTSVREIAKPIHLGSNDHNAPATTKNIGLVVQDWSESSHAASGINCLDCHRSEDGTWQNNLDHQACKRCHPSEIEGFMTSRHGMRISVGLSPMQPSLARLPMRTQSSHKTLTCESCHASHKYNTSHAAVEACIGCHKDRHSLEYKNSPHYALWQKSVAGQGSPGSGVSCASCHFPRIANYTDRNRVTVVHNQNDYLRPNEKMIRPVCLSCHGLGFTLDALADSSLVQSNFQSTPKPTVDSINFATVLRWSLEGRRPPWEKNSDKPQPKQ